MHNLLGMLLLALAAHGLGAEGLDPWRGWVVFKESARASAESPDPGVSVQISVDEQGRTTSLVFLRQAVEITPEGLEPAGGVVCEFDFDADARITSDWEAWSFDTSSFERFVDLVEGNPDFQHLVVQKPLSSRVYWREA